MPVWRGSIIGRNNIEEFFNHVSTVDDFEDRHLVDLAPTYEFELEACCDGVDLALDWSNLPCVIEMDCDETVKMIRSGDLSRSPFTGLVHEIKQLMATRKDMRVELISR
jgi:hypothetical protein